MNVDPMAIAGGVATAVTAIGGAFALGRGAARRGRGLATFLEDWNGEPARKGVPARPGVMERLAAIEKELTLNGGKSLKDTVVRMAGQLEALVSESNKPPVQMIVNQAPVPPTTPPSS